MRRKSANELAAVTDILLKRLAAHGRHSNHRRFWVGNFIRARQEEIGGNTLEHSPKAANRLLRVLASLFSLGEKGQNDWDVASGCQ